MVKEQKFGFLRETTEKAIKAGFTKNGIKRTGLDEYISVIFPDIKKDEWINDRIVPGNVKKTRPDYRCEQLKLIVEFDGIDHFQNPKKIIADKENTKNYESLGYKVVRIPYFVQLTNDVVKTMFGVEVGEELFPEDIASFDESFDNTPACLCPAGLKLMVDYYKMYPKQYETNIKNFKRTL